MDTSLTKDRGPLVAEGVKETREILQFVVAAANLGVDLAGKNPVAILLSLGRMVDVLQLAAPALSGMSGAYAELSDGLSADEKKLLFAEIEKLKAPNATLEQVLESALKAGVALTDFFGLFKAKKPA